MNLRANFKLSLACGVLAGVLNFLIYTTASHPFTAFILAFIVVLVWCCFLDVVWEVLKG